MSTAKTWQTVSLSSAATSKIGERLGHACKGGEILLFVSDLGGGKTTLVKGLAIGLGSSDPTGSPSFAISKIYNCRDGLKLHHFDFYRLPEAGIMAHELSEIIDDTTAVIAIEWGDVVGDVLPPRHVEIHIDKTTDNEDARTIRISCPAETAYILEGLE